MALHLFLNTKINVIFFYHWGIVTYKVIHSCFRYAMAHYQSLHQCLLNFTNVLRFPASSFSSLSPRQIYFVWLLQFGFYAFGVWLKYWDTQHLYTTDMPEVPVLYPIIKAILVLNLLLPKWLPYIHRNSCCSLTCVKSQNPLEWQAHSICSKSLCTLRCRDFIFLQFSQILF